MKSKLTRFLGLILYFFVMGKLMNFDWKQLIQPKPFLTVIAGMLILTLSQYHKKQKKEELVTSAKFNVLFAGFLSSLLSVLSYITPSNLCAMKTADLANLIVPLLYGSIVYLILNLVFSRSKNEPSDICCKANEMPVTVSSEEFSRSYGLTNRECHVAMKLLENISNKEIAEQLFISEATVKKHIQNIYQKLQVADRNGFRNLYANQTLQNGDKE